MNKKVIVGLALMLALMGGASARADDDNDLIGVDGSFGMSQEERAAIGVGPSFGERLSAQREEWAKKLEANREGLKARVQEERQKIEDKIRAGKEEFSTKRGEIEDRFKEEMKNLPEGADKTMLREQFKKEMEANREDRKDNMGELRDGFKQDVSNMRDEARGERKGMMEERAHLRVTAAIERMQKLIDRISSRVAKMTARGIDASTVKTQLDAATTALADLSVKAAAVTADNRETTVPEIKAGLAAIKTQLGDAVKSVKVLMPKSELKKKEVEKVETTSNTTGETAAQ